VAGLTQDPEAWARLGAKIREQRETLGMSRRQLSAEAGVSEKSIQVAEEGRTPRARWPQSLRLIEAALRWAPGSMVHILEGGEPEQLLDLFTLAEQESGIPDQARLFPEVGRAPAEEVDEGAPPYLERSQVLTRLPKKLRASLEDVLSFGRKAKAFGASDSLVEEYEEAVDALIIDLTSRSIAYEGHSRDPGLLWHWRDAMRQDPMLRHERNERLREAEIRRRRMLEEADRLYRAANPTAVDRTVVVGGTTSEEVLRELRKLAEEVAQIAKKVDSTGSVPGVDRSFTEEEMEQQPKPSDG
jgi:DNA-binding XRE family transcriptional regulator